MTYYTLCTYTCALCQGCPNSVLEGHCPTEFSSNCPQHTDWKFLVCLIRARLAGSRVFNLQDQVWAPLHYVLNHFVQEFKGLFCHSSSAPDCLSSLGAKGISDTVVAFISQNGLQIKHIMGISTDDASVIKHCSVFTLLKQTPLPFKYSI